MCNSHLVSKPALVLTLHGAGVAALGQVDAYASKAWAHLVAPTNRRRFGFDWEDWGRLDAVEVLEDAQSHLESDPRRVYLTGHSMGGHGVWHLGVTYPDRFAALAPSAGWVSFFSYTGFVRGRSFGLDGVSLKIGKTSLDWATVSMVCLDGDGFDKPGRVLIAATGRMQNTGAELEDLGDDRITLRDRWGAEPVLCEGIPAEIVLPVAAGRVRLYALDESGNRRTSVAVAEQEGKALLSLAPAHKTVWYEAEIDQ